MPRYVATDHGLGRLSNGHVEIFAPDADGVDELLLSGMTAADLASAEARATVPRDEVRLQSPLSRPTVVWAVGYAYAEHSAEVGRAHEPDEDPVIFIKATSSITGPHDDILLPALAPERVDYEGEIAVVISREAKEIDAADAYDYIFGFTAANDVSARDVQRSGLYNGGTADPSKGKSFDTFTPLGPCITTADEYPDPDDIELTTWVNGEQRQHARSSQLRNSVPKIVAFASRFTTLHPGDVILTGTPAGVGHPAGRFLSAGDVVRIEVEGVGALENTVTAG